MSGAWTDLPHVLQAAQVLYILYIKKEQLARSLSESTPCNHSNIYCQGLSWFWFQLSSHEECELSSLHTNSGSQRQDTQRHAPSRTVRRALHAMRCWGLHLLSHFNHEWTRITGVCLLVSLHDHTNVFEKAWKMSSPPPSKVTLKCNF